MQEWHTEWHTEWNTEKVTTMERVHVSSTVETMEVETWRQEYRCCSRV